MEKPLFKDKILIKPKKQMRKVRSSPKLLSKQYDVDVLDNSDNTKRKLLTGDNETLKEMKTMKGQKKPPKISKKYPKVFGSIFMD